MNFVEFLKKRKEKKTIQRVLKIIIMQVTFIGIQQSNIKSRQNSLPSKNSHIQVKDKFRVKNGGQGKCLG
jgi:hypothetical protein